MLKMIRAKFKLRGLVLFAVLIVGVLVSLTVLIEIPVVVDFGSLIKSGKSTLYLIDNPLLKRKDDLVTKPYFLFSLKRKFWFIYRLEVLNKPNVEEYRIEMIDNKGERRNVYVFRNDEVFSEEFTTKLDIDSLNDVAQKQYPYFFLFPHRTALIYVDYIEPYVLSVYPQQALSQQEMLDDLDFYLRTQGVSVSELFSLGVKVDYKSQSEFDNRTMMID